MKESTIKIYFENLAVIKGSSKRLPLRFLNHDCHVHGGLRIRIGSRDVPYLGFFGPDDVCFSLWIEELDAVMKAFEGNENSTYVFDEGEQGQPAFLFEKEGEAVYLSIVDAEFSGGEADPDWQKIFFLYEDLTEQYKTFRAAFLDELRKAAPDKIDEWMTFSIRNPTCL